MITNLKDKTYLSGPVRFAGAIYDWPRFGQDWLEGQAGALVPYTSAMSEIARAMDPTAREINSIAQAVQARIPMARQNLPAKIDIAGQPIAEARPIPGQPMNIREVRKDPVAEAMLEVGGDIAQKRAPNDRQFGVELTDAEHESFATYLGESRWDALRPVVDSQGWQALKQRNPVQAGTVLEQRWDKASEQARLRWLAQNQQVLMRRRVQDAEQAALRRGQP